MAFVLGDEKSPKPTPKKTWQRRINQAGRFIYRNQSKKGPSHSKPCQQKQRSWVQSDLKSAGDRGEAGHKNRPRNQDQACVLWAIPFYKLEVETEQKGDGESCTVIDEGSQSRKCEDTIIEKEIQSGIWIPNSQFPPDKNAKQ